MKNFKFKTTFSCAIRPLVSEEKDFYLSTASLADVSRFLPDIDTEENIDLLPIAFNSFVANRVNKNGDVIDSETALALYKNFINKPINVEHQRQKVIGTVLTAGFSEFGTDKVLSAEEVKQMTGPFNVTLGGVVWRVVNDDLADKIEEAADPTSESYQNISASWELGFNEYALAALAPNEKNLENAEIISDPEKVEELKEHLKALGGEGVLDDGRMLYRKVISKVIPLGIGLTEHPAAEVKGVAVKKNAQDIEAEEESVEKNKKDSISSGEDHIIVEQEREESPDEDFLKNKETISQSIENNVIETKDSTIMQIKNISDITDEALKEIKASVITDFIREELEKASEDFSAQQNEVQEALKSSKEEKEALSADHSQLKEEMEKVQGKLGTMEAENLEREKLESFTQRMAELDESFELNDEAREALAEEIKDIDEETWAKKMANYSKLLKKRDKDKDKDKKKLPWEKDDAGHKDPGGTNDPKMHNKYSENVSEEKPKEELAASEEQEVVDEAIDGAEEQTNPIPVTSEAAESTIYDKYKEAFGDEGFDVKF